MLFGNPNTFAIWCDQVDSWSTERFKNGCFGFFIGGRLIWSPRSTLGVDINALSKLHCIGNDVEDDSLFHLSVVDAYMELRRRAFPDMDSDAEDSDFSSLVSPESLSDEGYGVFLIESGEIARLICGLHESSESIFHVDLKKGEFQSTVAEAIAKWKALSP